MDSDFPSVLFPCFYNTAPPDTELGHCSGSWGSYDRLRPNGSRSFRAQHTAAGESWSHMEPVPVPLLSPKHTLFSSSKPANPLDFREHLQNFFTDYPCDAFSPMVNVLGKTMNFRKEPQEGVPQTQYPINMWEVTDFMDKLKSKNCTRRSSSARLDAYCRLLFDSLHSVPVELLGSLLHEELSQQSQDAAFCEANTGGALDFIPLETPLAPSAQETPLAGCLVYSANGVDKVCFQQVELQPHAVVCSDEVCSFLLKGPVQQISSRALYGHSCVAVRSLYHCAVWSLTSAQQPHLLQALSSAETLSCTCLSPHVVGELLVAGESGAAHLWKLGHGTQQVRKEDSNLYFNSQSPWRWCEFSAHPRVMLYADRTGAELTDIRVQPSSCHTLFRISQAAECRSGERLLLCQYLSGVHPFHHLVCTQYSAYIMDERFPCVPMLKYDHMMEAPPVFCQVLPNSAPGSGGAARILLGSQRSQEVTLLQYSGGRAEACMSRGPVQALLRPRDSLQHLPTQLPHRTEASQDRLAHPATGLTAVHLKSSASAECFCVFQLLQTGDIFYQILEKNGSDVSCGSRTQESPEGVQPAPASVSSQREPPLGSDSLSIWRQWLQRLARSLNANSSKPDHAMVKSRLTLSQSKPRDDVRRRRLLQHLRTSLHQRSTLATFTEDVVPLTEEVRPEEWSDELSSRLSTAWDSEEGWHAWWSERLGINQAEKTQALKRRRRKRKEVKRASGLTLLAMSGSFTSSVSYQSDLSELSDWASSDTSRVVSQSEELPTDTQDRRTLTPVPAPSEEFKVQAQPLLETPSTKRRAQQLQQLHSQTPVPSSSGPLEPAESSRDAFSWSQLSSQRLSQSFSQSASQASQPKKKSRMGF